jgi:hypothetical protein
MFWGMWLLFGAFATVFAFWLRSRLKELPSPKNAEPLRNEHCLICDGWMTDHPRWHWVDCGVIRYAT